MIYSMTGYGRAEGSIENKQFIIELKSLNGKQFELNARMHNLIKPFEPQLRNILAQTLVRGSVELNFTLKQDGAAKPAQINTELVKSYYQAMKSVGKEMYLEIDEHPTQILAAILRIPEVVGASTEMLTEEDFQVIANTVKEAANQLKQFRSQEGIGLANDIAQRITNIETLLAEIPQYEHLRIDKIRQRIQSNIEIWVSAVNIDSNRMEQEIIYYLEKIDISEEKQRLKAHIDYFRKLMQETTDEGIGKKLGFVLQEVGREINTLGSKANDATIQKIVVNMKDELEKAKEQSLNIL